MEKHKDELFLKSKMNKRDFTKLLQLLLNKIVIVPAEVLKQYKEKAFKIVKEIDQDDTLFVACVLAYDNSILWSNDKKLKQLPITVLNTEEMIELLNRF